jgi:ribonuclease BN (tRNA processing enzyme)
MAQAAGVRRLILSHIGPNLASHPVMEKGIGDVRRIYEGEIVFSTEGLALDLRRRS